MEREPQKQTTDEYRNNFDAIFKKREEATEQKVAQQKEKQDECGK